jgi:molecular chaperone GrpE (heat shock protein)
MWQRVFKLFRSKPAAPIAEKSHGELYDELQQLKKQLRKQGMAVDEVLETLREQAEEGPDEDLEPLIELAEAFFYLDRWLKGLDYLSTQRRQALDMVWSKLERLLLGAELRMVREAGVPFDARLHEAIGGQAGESGVPLVVRIVQPGFVQSGQVRRVAKAVVGNTGHTN